ncbi:membrane dipeptidase [Streptomyces ipomoeae]|uniref:Membrane dipeptidase n=1 Tax=Streptomyces ipomoeae TaxID=103232 RepID=A0AAE8VTF1_9ACTN|nr:dipeptidase [Streptomyces ipomoeae]MDX2823470.1 dipeptidase [Streptomyces ipomoeae]MDX2874698.1 dipeptidase [Streptomyces ipomoeae]TQE16355.1 membrane dipeptidase [Streptomyces ipomoeae]TQE36671.1 membrane dipeptidase [Streptomyces ipomoeae]
MADLQDELQATAEAGELDARSTARRKRKPKPGSRSTAAESMARTDGRAEAPVHAPADGTLGTPEPDGESPEALAQAHAFLAGYPVADGYSGLPWVLRHLSWYDLELGEGAVDTDVPRMRKGHIGALFWSLHLPDGMTGDRAVGATLEQLDLVRMVAHAHPEGLRLVYSAGEITDARNCGRVGILLGPAGASAIGDSLGILRALHQLGLQALTVADVSWAGEKGLTRFGEEVVREMNRVGVLADVSGAAEPTLRRTLEVSRAPVLCTRSAAHALRPHPANLPDDLLAELGAAHGLCMVPLTAEQTGPSIRDVADHLDHVRSIAGPECVGLSGTYDSGAAHPQDLNDASCYPHLVAELMRRGWSETDLALLTWGNVQRVLRMADFTARAAQDRRVASTAKIEELDG